MYTLITLDIDAMNYFRAILKLRESSPRALALTKHLITLNPSNYTLWQYRREILQNEDLESEQNFISELAMDNLKNYQIWHHRKWCVVKTRQFVKELPKLDHLLDLDAKNYHLWGYRYAYLTVDSFL